MHDQVKWIKQWVHLFVFMLIPFCSFGQNLVPNPSFEDYSQCPLEYGMGGDLVTVPWLCGSLATVDVMNACGGPTSMMGVPANDIGYQDAHTGVGYAGFFCYYSLWEYREYPQVQLTEPLIAGLWYTVSFYVSLAENSCAVDQIGAYFSVSPPTYGPVFQEAFDYLTPQVISVSGYLSDFNNWMFITGCFQAAGGEQYITIGNFQNDDEINLQPGCPPARSYYFIDDVTVELGDEPLDMPFDLGGPEFACFSYEIDPDASGNYYIWEDGSHEPTLTVTESGTYNLTITDGCNFGVDSIEVIVAGNDPPVELGPHQVSLCIGDVYTITLDPDLSEYEWNDGSNDSEYSITTSGIYSVTLDDGCVTSVDFVEVDVFEPLGSISLGEDVFLCSGETMEFSFDPTLGEFLWQDNASTSNYIVDDEGVYALTITNVCGSASDEVIITNLEVPEVELGDDVQILCSGDILDFEIDPALGDILWQDGSSAVNYAISTPGVYTLFITNECGTGSDQIEVIFVDQPVFDLGADIQLCPGDTLLLDGDGVVGDYVWQDNSSATTYTVNSEGTYALTLTTGCGVGTDTILVEYETFLSPFNLGPDFSLCPGETSVLYTTSPGANYLWQDLSTADSLVVSNAGTYHVHVFNSCSSFTDTIMVSVNDMPPQVDLPSSLNLCQGQIITLDAGIIGVTYLWNDNSQNAQLNVSSPGTYSLTVTNACGVDMDTVIITDGGPAPIVSLGSDIDLCPGDVFLLTPTFTDVDTWLWQDGSSLSSFSVSTAGEISVEVSNSCGVSFDTVLVNLLPATPPLDLGADTSLCPGESLTLSINTTGVNIVWSDHSTNPDLLVSNPGVVFASISNSCGENTDTVLINALHDIPTLNLGPDQSLCPGEVITINPGITDVFYSWQDGSTFTDFISTHEQTLILIISNDCGTSTDTLEIFESTQGPQVDLGNDIQVCDGEIVTIISNISGVNYLWQDGSTDPEFTTILSGTFILEVNNNCGTDVDTILVDISGIAPTPDLGVDTTLCEGISFTLVSMADQITSVIWQDGSSSPFFTVSSPGTFTLAESNRCGNASDTIVITYLDAPDPFTLGSDTILCPGEFVVLTSPSTSFDIMWQDGSTLPTIIANQANIYSLQLSNDCGSAMDEIEIDIDNNTPQLNLEPFISWCPVEVINLNAEQPFLASYLWSTGSIAPSIQITAPGMYTIDVTTLCSSSSLEINVMPGNDCITHNGIYIPNVFSPNDDNINDVFTVSFGADLDVTSVDGAIFDRWGNLVFGSSVIPFTWKGDFDTKILNPGVYCYRIVITYTFAGAVYTEILRGDVTILR